LTDALAGIFVGGAGTRMGGVAKGLLRTSDGMTLVERLRGVLEGLGLKVVLVGASKPYVGLGLEAIEDEPSGIGPLGGLVGLLRRAEDAPAIALACDMPFVSSALVARLLTASNGAPMVAPRRHGRWEPLCARYDPARVAPLALALIGAREHSLQRLLRDGGAVELPIEDSEAYQLRDWDTPDDVATEGR
jgi:molybdopterin-guanine dinucleotide biosynthesis protein A